LAGKKTGPNPTDRGKRGTKRSLLTEANGIPIGLAVDGANRVDFKMARATIESIPVERPEPTRRAPQGLCLDKGYDYDEVRELAVEFSFTAHIRCRGEEAKAIKKERRLQSSTLGRGAGSQLDESLPQDSRSLGEARRHLRCNAPSIVRHHYVEGVRPTGIGSYGSRRVEESRSSRHPGSEPRPKVDGVSESADAVERFLKNVDTPTEEAHDGKAPPRRRREAR
jgi:hypothetical protein